MPPKEVVTTFHNVLISIEAPNSKEAYNKLCRLLHDAKVEYTTDTYSVYGDRVSDPRSPRHYLGEKRSTEELMGKT